jgi:peptide chain release factor 2
MRSLSSAREELEPWLDAQRRVDELLDLVELAALEEDQAVLADASRDAQALQTQVDRLEFQLRLNGPYDRSDAIVTITVGTGGVDAQDWAQMLMRMYLRWGERQGYGTEILDQAEGEEAGVKGVTIAFRGPHAYGYLKGERGTHRLVRLSPFDQAHRRHTSFARVEVMPDVGETAAVEVRDEDVDGARRPALCRDTLGYVETVVAQPRRDVRVRPREHEDHPVLTVRQGPSPLPPAAGQADPSVT